MSSSVSSTSSLLLPTVGEVITPAMAMKLAIQEGEKGAGFVAPNPLVGCTIVDREHRFLAVGHHRKVGGDHAEIDALRKLPAFENLEGCHVYVTLEPCAHQGRTPSCAKTLAPLKPASLTYAVEDPNPLVAGKGARIMHEAGVRAEILSARADISAVDRERLTADAEDLAEIFLHNYRHKEPFVAVKVASSLDGKMAFVSGESKWITGEKAREHVQLVRAKYDAVLVGRSTFVADNPSLNVRHAQYPDFKNKAVLIDPKGQALDALVGSNLLKVRPADSVFVVVDKNAGVQAKAGVKLLPVSTDGSGKLVVSEILAAFRAEGLTSIMVEGGSHTIGAFFEAGVVRRLHVYSAPLLIGGKHGLAWSAHFGRGMMSEATRLSRVKSFALGDDIYFTARIS